MFQNKTVLITGAAVGIGRACALLFAERGANVVIADVDAEKLENTAADLRKITNNMLISVCDVRDAAAAERCVAEATERFGGVDILVNNAALWRQRGYFTELTAEDWHLYFEINVMGTVNFTKAALPGMLERGYGRIVNVASVAGVYGNARMSHYSATKGAVISLTKALAKEVAERGVTVNAVSPGTVTNSADPDPSATLPSPLSYAGRTGSGRENAELICFLAGENAGYINGQNIQIDGCRKRL